MMPPIISTEEVVHTRARQIVILEGPDGAGKTSMKDRLLSHFELTEMPRACTSEGGPVDELWGWTRESLAELDELSRLQPHEVGGGGGMLFDRYPFFSEICYGPVCRRRLSPGFEQTGRHGSRLLWLKELGATLVWCMPPIEAVTNNVWQKDTPQMPGVVENIESIYWLYRAIMAWWAALGGNFMTWDYTSDDWGTWSENFQSRYNMRRKESQPT